MNAAIEKRVHELYWEYDVNCARSTLICLSELFHDTMERQTLNSAIGLHGAGGFGAQCGLVEGALMFFGIYFSDKGLSENDIARLCFRYAEEFTKRFGSLSCCDLRPTGFHENDPPHACERLTCDAIEFTYMFIKNTNDIR